MKLNYPPTKFRTWLPVLAALLVGTVAFAASPKYVCGLTGKTSTTCCCEQKDGKLVCKTTGKVLAKCCCTVK